MHKKCIQKSVLNHNDHPGKTLENAVKTKLSVDSNSIRLFAFIEHLSYPPSDKNIFNGTTHQSLAADNMCLHITSLTWRTPH